ncbi:MAG: metallophosphoesterase family protein, partial [Bacteroidota bacterium]|nr:metallophosphoesterase family protein [Bacteroidota bacterium]
AGMIDVGSGVQKVVLTNLKPGTRYYYCVVSKEVKTLLAYKVVYGDSIRSKIYTFATPSSGMQKFSFLAFNDIHNRPQFTEQVVKRESGFNFVVLNGDIIDNINKESDITDYLLKPFSASFATEIPFFFVRGNHETRGEGARSLYKYIDTPTGNFYYSFTYGNTHFVMLDCGEDKPDNNQYYFGLADYDQYRSQEAIWLAKEVQTPEYKQAAFRVICLHMPITLKNYENSAGGGMKDCSQKFVPILNKAGADLILCGHTHTYAVMRPNKGVTNIPIIVGGGPFTDKTGEKTTYTVVEVNQNLLTATLKKANGEVIDKVEVKSPARR